MDKLRLALAKGSLLAPTIDLLAGIGFDVSPLKSRGRRLHLTAAGNVEYIIARPADVPTYVEWGAVDAGFVGSDVLMESKYEVFELADLGYGRCRFVLAAPRGPGESSLGPVKSENAASGSTLKIATKYPKIAADYLARRGLQAEVIKLYGSMELAPLVGLADGIIDLSSTGRTLADNGLEVVEEIAEVGCRLIANYVSYKLKSVRINELVGKVNAKD